MTLCSWSTAQFEFELNHSDLDTLSLSHGIVDSLSSAPSTIIFSSDSIFTERSEQFDATNKVYWCKFSIKNNSDRFGEWILDYQNWSFVHLYQIEEGKIVNEQVSGHMMNYHDRDYPFANNNYIRIEVPHKTSNVYVARLEATSNNFTAPSSLNVPITPRVQIDRKMRKQETLIAMFLSIYLILFLYNLFIYFSTKDVSYIFYLIHVLAVGYLIANNSGFIMSFMSWAPGFPSIKPYLESSSSAVNMMGIALFTKSFLNTKEHLPILNKVLTGAIVTIVIVTIGMATKQPIWLFFTLILSFGLMMLFLTTGIASYIKKVPSSQYYILAYSFSIIGVLTLLAVYTGKLEPNTFISTYPTHIGYGLELLFFSFALANKINVLKSQNESQKEQIIDQLREADRLQKNINKELEIKVEERTRSIKDEKEKSEALLLNILPKPTVQELKQNGKAKPRFHPDVTMMMTDFAGFTALSSTLDPELLVNELDDLFHHFDDITEKYNLEKIKTIGDAYMAAAGLHDLSKDHPIRTVAAAAEIIEYLFDRNKSHEIQWNIRIGIHTGSVVSGVVGKKKFTFDTWGDTVNVASRMEEAGMVGRINVSEATYARIKDKRKGESRGMIEVKGKGKMEMYFV